MMNFKFIQDKQQEIDKKLERLYKKGKNKLDKEFNVLRIIKSIRKLRQFYKYFVANNIQQNIKNNGFGLIDVDTDSEEQNELKKRILQQLVITLTLMTI